MNTKPPDTTPPSHPHGEPARQPERTLNFIEHIVETDNASGTWGVWGPGEKGRENTPRVHTRFPPEPNGYLHIGHAKSICLNLGLAEKYHGKFNLRFDDTNPAKEEQEYVDNIKADVKWLGGDWVGPHGGGLFFASNYFEAMFAFAEELVKKSKAYVCDMTPDEVSKNRGTPSIPARSFFRDRPVAENLALLHELRAGEHPNGSKTVRAKIDLTSPNFNLRDPVMYRIVHETHHNTGDKWCLYPMYDWAHGIEDSLEGITHSVCTLEFENHRPLYDWFIDSINEGRTADGSGAWGKAIHHPRQIEFARLNLTYTVMSKRFLLNLVKEKRVNGWDDPRMPTLSGLRRRGYTPDSIRHLCEEVGVTKTNSVIDLSRLENSIRDDLNKRAPRAMGVLRPLKVVIENWDEGKVDHLDFVKNPENAAAGTRKIPFSRVIYIEHDDFMEIPGKKFFRLAPGAEVRLRWAYFLRCTGVVKDTAGRITELRAIVDHATRGGDAPAGPNGEPPRKVKGTIHWVSAAHAIKAEVRLFDRLFNAEEPGKTTGNQLDDLNPHSLEIVEGLIDPALASALPGEKFQFERLGYFCVDPDSAPGSLVFNRTVTLKDSWAKDSQK